MVERSPFLISENRGMHIKECALGERQMESTCRTKSVHFRIEMAGLRRIKK